MSSRTSGVAVAVKGEDRRPSGDAVGAPAPAGGLGEAPVVGTKVVTPFRDTVRLVHGKARERHLREDRCEALVGESLRRDVEKTPAAFARGLDHLLPLGGGHQRVDRGGRDAAAVELVHLVLHERDQGRDDQRRARQQEGRELIADRLARTGRHDGEHVAALEDRPDDLLLPRAEGAVAEDAARARRKDRKSTVRIIAARPGGRSAVLLRVRNDVDHCRHFRSRLRAGRPPGARHRGPRGPRQDDARGRAPEAVRDLPRRPARRGARHGLGRAREGARDHDPRQEHRRQVPRHGDQHRGHARPPRLRLGGRAHPDDGRGRAAAGRRLRGAAPADALRAEEGARGRKAPDRAHQQDRPGRRPGGGGRGGDP